MLPDRVSNPGPLTYESGALPIALRGPAKINVVALVLGQHWYQANIVYLIVRKIQSCNNIWMYVLSLFVILCVLCDNTYCYQ